MIEFNLRNPFLFASMNSMKAVFGDKSIEAQKRIYADPDFRRSFSEELGRRAVLQTICGIARTIKETSSPSAESIWNGRPSPKSRANAASIPLDVIFRSRHRG